MLFYISLILVGLFFKLDGNFKLSFLEQYNLTHVINARGTFTPLGVSRSSEYICDAVAVALSSYFVIDELQDIASKSISDFAGTEAATVTHCVASAITVSVAATITGVSEEAIFTLPETKGVPNHVVIPSTHCVNYGHSILQAIRISGAIPVIAGEGEHCSLEDIEQQIASNNTCCLLLVSSKLVKGNPLDLKAAVKIAHKHNIPTIIDGAAQDFRIKELIETNTDLLLVSAQKYLAAPTAGLVMGGEDLIQAVRAQEKGVGRGMKATKESLIGVLSAIQEREKLDLSNWKELQQIKVDDFVTRANAIEGFLARLEPDPTGLPFSRVYIRIDPTVSRLDAKLLATNLKSGNPSIWVIDQNASEAEISFELVQTSNIEIDLILERLVELVVY